MDPGLEVIIFMGVILKIPVIFACWLIYYAVKSKPEVEEAPDDGEYRFRRFRREPKRPRGPRRGPGAPDSLPLPCPEQGSLRVRGIAAESRQLMASGRRPRH
jgi:hypothetical protein